MEQNEARGRILDAALGLFAEKGYDGSRTEEIARMAGVNKALIYYYFKSKQDLLDTLMQDFLEKTRGFLDSQFRNVDFREDDTVVGIIESAFAYLERNEDLLRLIIVESLKKGPRGMVLLDFVSMYLGPDRAALAELVNGIGLDLEDGVEINSVRVTEFFTLMSPMIMYILIREKWETYFSVDKATMKRQFIQALQSTHIAQHKH